MEIRRMYYRPLMIGRAYELGKEMLENGSDITDRESDDNVIIIDNGVLNANITYVDVLSAYYNMLRALGYSYDYINESDIHFINFKND